MPKTSRRNPSQVGHKNYGPTEHQMQVAYFDWVRTMRNNDKRYEYIFAVPNGAWLGKGVGASSATGPNRFANAAKLKREGLEPGVPDIIIAYPVPPFCGCALELKRKPNDISKRQADWLRRLAKVGWCTEVCWSTEELIEITEFYFR
jgi:hypothetical protein